jgi:hypothetical protein
MNDETKAADYSLIVEVALDSLCTCLVRDAFLVVERGHRGSITGTNDERCVLFAS